MILDKQQEERIRELLLGKLEKGEQQALESELAANQAAFDRFREMEDELIQDYADGQLEAGESAQFETDFLVTPERRKKLLFSQAFRAFVTRHGDEEKPARQSKDAAWRAFTGWFRFPSPVLLGTAALLVMGIALIWSVTQLRDLQDEFTRVQQLQANMISREDAIRAELAREQGNAVRLTRELEQLRSDRDTLEEELAQLQTRYGSPALATFLLAPGLLRDRGPANRIQLRPGDSLLELYLDIGLDDFGSYRAVLLNSSGSELISQSRLEAVPYRETVAVRLILPAQLLVTDDYSIRLLGLTAAGQSETVFQYAFQVLR